MSSELQKIDFYDDEIVALKDEKNDKVYVNIRGICASLGLDFSSQRKKLLNDSTYSESLSRGAITTVKGQRESLFLDSELLQGWLFSIQTSRLRPEIREKHIAYKRECFKVLSDYFTKGIAINPRADELDLLTERVEKLEARLSNKTPLHQQKKNMLHEKAKSGILEAISTEGKTTEQLYAHFSRHISALVLHTALIELEHEKLIAAFLKATCGRGRYATLYQKTL